MAGIRKIAHRGASGRYPENTRLAFAKAIEAGADMIEIDCQLSRDGHVVVFHDERLNRIGRSRGTVRSKSLEQLKRLDIGAWRGRAFAGERVLTLEEALQSIAGNADLCVEIKSYRDSLPGIELKVLFIVSHYDYFERTTFSSFDYGVLARLRQLAPEANIGLIVGSPLQPNWLEAARGVITRSVHVQKQLATREVLAQAWEEGLDVYVWTVNDVHEMQTLSGMGVQGLISDFPEKFSQLSFR
ncbi:MAG TPA: glycerophosphodiester phosphodiesterase family protein [Candidatus Binatia bacterium]